MPANYPKSILATLVAQARRLSFPGRSPHILGPIPLKAMPPADRGFHEAIVLNPVIIATPRLRHASTFVSGSTASAAHPVAPDVGHQEGPPDQGDPVCTPRYTKVIAPAMDTLDPPDDVQVDPATLPDLQSNIPSDRMRAPIPHAEKAATPASVLVEASNSPLADPTPPKSVFEKVERAMKTAMNPLSAQGEAAATSMALKKQGFDKMRGEDT